MNIFTFILTALGPWAVRVIAALGFTAVSYAGVSTTVTALVSYAQTNWSAMPTTVLQLITLSAIPQVMGMIFGAYAARISMSAITGAAKYVLKK